MRSLRYVENSQEANYKLVAWDRLVTGPRNIDGISIIIKEGGFSHI